MNREQLKKNLLESGMSEDQAESILESFDKYQKSLEDGVQARIDEGVKKARVDLEAAKLKEINEHKAEAEKRLEEELKVFESQLAQRVRGLVESSLVEHGDRCATILEQSEAKKGSALFEEISTYVNEAKREIQEQAGVDPKEIASLKRTIAEQKAALIEKEKKLLHETARANVAEGDLQILRESVESNSNVSVVIEEVEAEPSKSGVPAGEQHEDSKTPITEGQSGGGRDANGDKVITEDMARMRKMAGIE